MTKKTFKITGMHCTSCALNIDLDLEDLDGVKSSQTSYAKSESVVEFDSDKISEQQIMDVINTTCSNS